MRGVSASMCRGGILGGPLLLHLRDPPLSQTRDSCQMSHREALIDSAAQEYVTPSRQFLVFGVQGP